jgi:hypothetical protein
MQITLTGRLIAYTPQAAAILVKELSRPNPDAQSVFANLTFYPELWHLTSGMVDLGLTSLTFTVAPDKLRESAVAGCDAAVASLRAKAEAEITSLIAIKNTLLALEGPGA